MRYRRHVFVCTNTRSCAGRGSQELVAELQRVVASTPELVGEVAVTPCGCLGPCFDGPIAVAYPEGSWIAGARAGDAAALTGWLGGDVAPEPFRYDWIEDE